MKSIAAHSHSLQSRDADEVSDFIARIYSGNEFLPHHAPKQEVSIVGKAWNGFGLYEFNGPQPFSVATDEARANYLFFTCTRGGATRSLNGETTTCTVDDVIPTSTRGAVNNVSGPTGFAHTSMIVGAERLNDFYARWIGRPVETPVHFQLCPMPVKLATEWKLAASAFERMLRMNPVPDTASNALLDHMMKLVVTGHPHNHMSLNPGNHARESLVLEAIEMIRSVPMHWNTLGAIACALHCSTSELENGILRQTGKGSREIFYEARMVGVNKMLRQGQSDGFIGALREYGFFVSDRFLHDYRRRFGELPSATYRGNIHASDVVHTQPPLRDGLCERKINEFIDASPDKSPSLTSLAEFLGLSEHATVSAFKEKFSRTPKQYVIDSRLERAHSLLCNTSESLLSIALECGFGTQSYLTTTMKKYFGVTPRQLRLTAKTNLPELRS